MTEPSLRPHCSVLSCFGEEPPSLEYIQAKDLFPPRELVKEEDKLQVRSEILSACEWSSQYFIEWREREDEILADGCKRPESITSKLVIHIRPVITTEWSKIQDLSSNDLTSPRLTEIFRSLPLKMYDRIGQVSPSGHLLEKQVSSCNLTLQNIFFLNRLPKTRSMDNLVTACDNGGLLTRTSSDPNLNNHQASLESRCSNDDGSDSESQGPLEQATDVKTKEDKARNDHVSDGDEGNVQEATEAHNNNEVTQHGNSSVPEAESPDLNYDDVKPGLEICIVTQEETVRTMPIPDQDHQDCPTLTKPPCPNLVGDMYVNTSCRDLTKSIKMAKEACRTDRKAVSQIPRNEISFLASNWESLQGMMKSVPVGEIGLRRHLSYEHSTRSLHSKHGRHTTGSYVSRDAAKIPYNFPASMHCSGPSMKSYRGLIASHNRPLHSGRFLPLVCPSPTPLLYQDDDGLPIPNDVVQQRLRQMEASYKQEVDLLRRQVWELQLQLEIRQYCAPPPEPEADYEDDFTCVKESDSSDIDDLYSDKSEDRLSETSWEPVDKKDTEVTRWVPDHMASHCFNCDSEFWLAKRRHHCRNCGNVFCAGCCHLKLPIPDQQLYDPVLVCNTCYDHIQVSRARELMSQQLKKPLAAASS
ncbi:myotubularin-related protein 4 [Bufo gargarizans]|uniref:myotubularin-related protein 4 n=1 Tax=Bufo gargarizans TaxID=30331 RepID=UPI001CF555BD|nr:myotubularin-related protein 4 [Bufo gargarizans]